MCAPICIRHAFDLVHVCIYSMIRRLSPKQVRLREEEEEEKGRPCSNTEDMKCGHASILLLPQPPRDQRSPTAPLLLYNHYKIQCAICWQANQVHTVPIRQVHTTIVTKKKERKKSEKKKDN